MTIDLLCVVLNIDSLGFLLVIACFQVVLLSKKFFIFHLKWSLCCNSVGMNHMHFVNVTNYTF